MSVQLSASVVPQPDALCTGRTIHLSQSTDLQVGRSSVVNLLPVIALENYDHHTHEDHIGMLDLGRTWPMVFALVTKRVISSLWARIILTLRIFFF